MTLRPTWEALADRPLARVALAAAPLPLAYVALTAFPLGPLRPASELAWWVWPALAAPALAAAFVRDASAGALVCGRRARGGGARAPGRVPPGQSCPATPAMQYLSTLPKDAVIAGDPMDLKCVPVSANRPVVISTQLAFSYERGYFREGRARMFASLRAYYGRSAAALAGLGRYGATHLLVKRGAVRQRAGRRPPPLARRPRSPTARSSATCCAAASPRSSASLRAAAAGTTALRPSTTSRCL